MSASLRAHWSLWVAGLVVAVLAVTLGVVQWNRHDDAPVRTVLHPSWHSGNGAISTDIPIHRLGDVYTATTSVLINRSPDPVVIDEVILPAQAGAPRVKLVGAYITPPHSENIGAMRGRADKFISGLRPAKGAVIPPGNHHESVAIEMAPPAGFTAKTSHLRAVANGIEVRSHVGNKHYIDWWPLQYVLCPQSCTKWESPGHHDEVPAPTPPAG